MGVDAVALLFVAVPRLPFGHFVCGCRLCVVRTHSRRKLGKDFQGCLRMLIRPRAQQSIIHTAERARQICIFQTHRGEDFPGFWEWPWILMQELWWPKNGGKSSVQNKKQGEVQLQLKFSLNGRGFFSCGVTLVFIVISISFWWMVGWLDKRRNNDDGTRREGERMNDSHGERGGAWRRRTILEIRA